MSHTSRSYSVIQAGANTINPAGSVNLLPLIRTAVNLSHKIIVEGHMLINLHVLRLLAKFQSLP